MSDTPSTQRIGAVKNGNGRRWYDTSRVIAWLFTAVSLFVLAWAAIVWNAARGAEIKNVEQDGKITSLEKSVEKMDGKLDRILERLK